MTRPDNKYTKTEAEILDLSLVIHAEHGGGNNSAFATHVVSSSGTDTYSAVSSAVGCLKGPKHGGANARVRSMILDIKDNCPNYHDRGMLKDYLHKILKREVFNKEGLIYGMGHAVYTKSDPRSRLLRDKALELAIEKDAVKEFDMYRNIEDLTVELFKELKVLMLLFRLMLTYTLGLYMKCSTFQTNFIHPYLRLLVLLGGVLTGLNKL